MATSLFETHRIDTNAVISLAISPFEKDLSFLQRMFDEANWRLYKAHTCREAMTELNRERMPVVICERQLPDGNWKDMLSQLAPLPERPRLIVMSSQADERLWSEVLNMGGFDVLAVPLREVEVGYAIGSAWLDWISEAKRAAGAHYAH